MGKPKTTDRKKGAAVLVQRIISPRLHELPATLKDHPWVRICKVCGKDCSREAITKLIYTHEACGCNAAPYRHLVDNIYHATCFVKRANQRDQARGRQPCASKIMTTPTLDTPATSPASNGSAASETPETEHALHGVWYRGDHGSAIPALCRRMERERNKLIKRITEWHELTDDALRLRCGEMTAQEIRTVRAVLNALPPNGELSDRASKT